MLPLGSYKIQIVDYHNPHLIWVDRDNVLQQIGIYGVLPHGKSLSFNPETSSYGFCEFSVDKWLPAANNLMKEFFEDGNETWFLEIHLDDGGIFEDEKHRFGEIYIKSKDGVFKNLSEFLTQSLFAIYNKQEFHEKLTQKLFTKLNCPDMKTIIKNLNYYYKKFTNKFEMYEVDLNNAMKEYRGDVLDEINWKFKPVKLRTDEGQIDKSKDSFVMNNFWQKMERKPKNMKMFKKLEMLKLLNKNVVNNSKTDSPEKRTEEKEAKLKTEKHKIEDRSECVKTQKASISEDDEVDNVMQYINAKYPNTKVNKSIINDDKIDIKTLTSSMCNFVEKIVSPVVMVHCKLRKNIKPIFTMRDIPFNEHIQIVLKNMSITQPMAIQSVTWHTILRGHSIFIIGPKLCGKTMGYLPSVCRLISDGTPEVHSHGPICIIVCATADSVTQVERKAKMLLGLNERILAVYPGVDDIFITTNLLNGCDLLISTPSTLVRLLQNNEYGIDLRRFRVVVLDDCERLNEVYSKEVKYVHYKIKEVERMRSNESRVQYIVASRVWCDFMEPLALKVPDTVISVSAFPECVIYSKSKMTVSFCTDKMASVFEFLDGVDFSKKVVIVCRFDEVKALETMLKCKKYIFTCNNDMTLSDLQNINTGWCDYEAPSGPILICTDENLSHLNITDAYYLVHYTLPTTYSFFRKRFFVLNDNYPSIFRSNNDCVKVKIIIDDTNTEKLPKIFNFIKRCTDDVPPVLDEICKKILAEKDVRKAETFVPICGILLTLGYCPELYDCQNRHTILKGFDEPPKWMPRCGHVTFKMIHLNTATNYSAQLLSHIDNEETKYPTKHTLPIKLGMHFGNVANRQLHGIPKIGDICAVSLRQDLFARCQVVKIIGKTRGSCRVLIKLLDEEKYEETKDIFLYNLPESLCSIETYTVQVRLANVIPRDNDVTFSELALNHIKELVDDEDTHVRGRVVGVVGKCLFVDTLEVCEDLSTLDQVVVKHDLKEELLRMHADEQPDHINKIKVLCGDSFSTVSTPVIKKTKTKNTGTWAHLNIGELVGVFVMSAINPEQCLLRISKFEPCMQVLLKDIKTHVESNPQPLTDVEVGDIVLAKFTDDDTYERARIDGIDGTLLNCFFVDQGDNTFVDMKYAMPITDKLINKIPFQCIECRLVGIQPPGMIWTDFCNTWLSNCADEGTKHFFAKAFTKQTAVYTGGNKYSIALIDTSSNIDVVINQLMIDLNLATVHVDEVHYLNDVPKADNKSSEEWEQVDNPKTDIPEVISNLPQPIRSVPLVGSDSESNESDTWEIYNMADIAAQFKQSNKQIPNLPALMPKEIQSRSDKSSLELDFSKISELDSDDTASSKTQIKTQIKTQMNIIDETRHPKLLWRQDKRCVNVKIQLMGVQRYDLTIRERSIKFLTYLRDTKYSFDFELYGVVNRDECTHSNKGQYILVKLVKVMQSNWGTLGNFDRIVRWIVYDVDDLDASSDEEVVDDTVVNIVREMHGKDDTDSDYGDDDFS